MKHINLKTINLIIIILLFSSFKGISQNSELNSTIIMGTLNASGNDAAGSSGSVTYSIGQLFYTYVGELVYNVAQGIQHNEKITLQNTPVNTIESKIEIVMYPNPTTDFVNLNMNGVEVGNGQQFYQLYDLQGRLLKQNTIDETEIQIELNDLKSSIYILQVYDNNKILKTFKILKK